MLHAHTVEQVRAAERELMARLPEGTLMQRAAAGLAAAVVDFLGSAYGRRVLLLASGLEGSGGGAAVAAWMLEALRRDHDVTLLTQRPPRLEEADRFFGTRLASGGFRIERAPRRKVDEAEFIMLRNGKIAFEGNATELREIQRRDRYIQAFLS